MKKLAFITLIAAIVFGVNISNVHAETSGDKIAIEDLSGNVAGYYDAASQVLTLRMYVHDGSDRVLIVISDRGGKAVHKDKVHVDRRGKILEIPMAGLSEGQYMLRVKGSQLSYYMRIKHK